MLVKLERNRYHPLVMKDQVVKINRNHNSVIKQTSNNGKFPLKKKLSEYTHQTHVCSVRWFILDS